MSAEIHHPTAYDLVCRERRLLVLWSVYHAVIWIAIALGAFFAVQYMTMPDRVLVLGRDRNIYLGNSASVESQIVIEDIALRAAYALLSRRYDYRDDRLLEMVCTKRGLGRARNYLDSTRELFERRMLIQEIEHCSVEYVSSGGGYFALVKGILNLSGIYFGYPHIQKRDFALLMRLERSASDFELPFRVEGVKLYEEEHLDE